MAQARVDKRAFGEILANPQGGYPQTINYQGMTYTTAAAPTGGMTYTAANLGIK